jgi:hypothetical protein
MTLLWHLILLCSLTTFVSLWLAVWIFRIVCL